MAKSPIPSARDFRQLLDYDAETGVLRWTANVARHGFAGRVAGSLHSRGYIRIKLFGRDWFAHRVAWLIHYGEWPRHEIDHINRDKTDNRISNLRDVPHIENARNCGDRSHNTSGYVGVTRFGRKWRAQIGSGKTYKHLGLFDSRSDAIIARRAAEADFGLHPNHTKRKRAQRKRDAQEQERWES